MVPGVFEDTLLVHGQKDHGLGADHDVVQLSGVDFSRQRPALNLDQPGVLQGVATDGPVNLAKHPVPTELLFKGSCR